MDNSIEITLKIDGIQCASCVSAITKAVNKMDGISSFTLSAETGIAKARIYPEKLTTDTIISVINSLGYAAKKFFYEDIEESFKKEKKRLLFRLGTAGFFSMQLMVASLALYSGYFKGIDETSKLFFQIISFFLSTPVVFYCGFDFHLKAVRGIINRTITMDTLISIGTLTAYFYSIYQISIKGEVYFDTAAMIITFILAGRTIEAYVRSNISSIFKKFREFLDVETTIIDEKDGSAKKVPASKIRKGNLLVIYPFERIPADAVIEEGETEVNESLLTGESLPVKRQKGDKVFAGASNLWGKIKCRVLNDAEASYVNSIMELIKESLLQKANIQRTADKAVAFFVPLVVLCALGTLVFHYLIRDELLSAAVMSSISVLIVACPCALGLATPLAISGAISRSSKFGVLIKKPEVLEAFKDIDTIVFDKTGTLTSGKLDISDIVLEPAFSNEDKKAIRRNAASIEKNIQHPIAIAIVKAAKDEQLVPASDINYYPGLGAEGSVDGKTKIRIGNEKFLNKHSIEISEYLKNKKEDFVEEGKVCIFYAEGNVAKALMVFEDLLRDEAVNMVEKLKKGRFRTLMLTGDNKASAEAVNKKLKLDSYKAELLPEDKINIIKNEKGKGHKIIYVGDGINDTPALVEADIGIAMNEPSQFAPLSADVVLLNDKLDGILTLLELGKRTFTKIKINLFWAFFYNIIAIPFAAMGYFPPVLSAGLMSLSSVSVCLNSIRN
ncbi:MAG: cation-translocating P-type ATPase [Candidatus Schekmanbacteria bacterium]|nr:MAG: cation-translocating P-type ATPase [Candidatus Schekmanbacteria bacterium]